MIEKYKVQLTQKAKNDLKRIILYIKDELQEPNIAKKYLKRKKEEIATLEYNPKRFEIVNVKVKNDLEIRKLMIKNYIAIYQTDEENKIVIIDRILYRASNWKDKI